MDNHNTYKKIAVINDMSGFGRCSLSVALPIISHMKIQACPIPTAIFSNHTGYDDFYCHDFTDSMMPYIEMWEKLGLEFDAALSGFLGSEEQIHIVEEFLRRFKTDRTKVIIDPVMGDKGKLYSTYTDEMCRRMKKLVSHANITTPNLTEACFLTDTAYHGGKYSRDELEDICRKIRDMGSEKVVISGIEDGDFVCNAVLDDGEFSIISEKKSGITRSGTGDIFASIIAADCVNGAGFKESVKKASSFVRRCIEVTEKYEIPLEDGVVFEAVINELK